MDGNSPSLKHDSYGRGILAIKRKTMKKEKNTKCFYVVWAAMIAMIFTAKATGVLTTAYVSGHSMVPTYKDGDVVLGTNLAELKADSVVMAHSPTGHDVIKRIVAVPGDTVEVNGDSVIVNGEPADGHENNPGCSISLSGAYTLGEDEYFLAGDNRCNSVDSRSYGPVKKSAIFGVVFVHLPTGK